MSLFCSDICTAIGEVPLVRATVTPSRPSATAESHSTLSQPMHASWLSEEASRPARSSAVRAPTDTSPARPLGVLSAAKRVVTEA